MRFLSILRIGLISLTMMIGGRAIYLQSEAWQRERLTNELCELVGNYLETSAVRSAFEGMQQGIARSSYPDACINVIDEGKHYSPDCIKADTNYQLTMCKVEGNKGIRAEIDYPTIPFFTLKLLTVWLSLWTFMLISLIITRAGVAYLAKRITEELHSRLFAEEDKQKENGQIARAVHWLALKSGVLRAVRDQTNQFDSQIREFENKIRTEALLRARNEADAERSQKQLERVRQLQHDIRSPLSALLSLEEMIGGDELSRQTLASGIRGIQRMLDDLNQEEEDESATTLTLLEVVAEEAVILMRPRFSAMKQANLSLEYDSRNLSPVMANSDGLKRVLDNLLENALDAITTGGNVRITVFQDGPSCKITLEDDGCGISPTIIPKLFSLGATFGKINGTGRGLYHCKKRIEIWKGHIECSSLLRGTQITITLPRVQGGAGFVGLPKSKRLWIIDDDPEVAISLRQAGYEIVGLALSYEEGSKLLKSDLPMDVLVLVDYRLNNNKKGTDLIAEQSKRHQMFLCTNDFDSAHVIDLAKQVGVRIIPKPLCFLVASIAV